MNYRIVRDQLEPHTQGKAFEGVSYAADGEDVFAEFPKAKAAALELIDRDIAALRRRRIEVRSVQAKSVHLQAE